MRFIPFRTIIVLLWLGLMGWFVRFEAFPGWFTGALDGYRALLSEGEVFLDSWMVVRFQGRYIGFSHMQVEMDEKNPAERYRITERTSLSLNMGGEQQVVNVGSVSRLDAFQRLVSFEFSLRARRYTMEIQGARQEGDVFRVHVNSDAAKSVSTIRIPDDVVIYSPMTMMAMGRMKPGETMRMKTLDPASMDMASVVVKALRKEPFAWNTNRTDATVLSVVWQNMEMLTWVDAQGQVLRQDTPYGWSMVATSSEEALKAEKAAGSGGGDLMTAMGVPVSGAIRDTDACRELKLKLYGLHFAINEVCGARQQVEIGTNATAIVTLRAGIHEEEKPLTAAVRADALASTTYIQSDAPAMKKKAGEITRGMTNDYDKALAIKNWVFKSLVKKLTVSIPSALDVLDQREGDCNEHTYLYVALARAAGLPSQVRVGIVYKDGEYFYHAWPAVYVGRWLELDPTLNYDELGTRHLTLLQGELGSQVKMMSALGQLHVDVLEQKY